MDESNTDLAWDLLNNMDENEKQILLNNFKLPDILNLLSDKDFRDEYIAYYKNFLQIFENISKLCDGESDKSDAEIIYDAYTLLEKDIKKELSVLLYNDREFQGFLTQILIGIIKQNMPEMLTLFKALGIDIEKYMLEAIRLGKGYKEYIIE